MLELQRLTYAINKNGEELPLVNEVSLKVPRGHFMAIVGPSGCGKTTLLKTIAGLNAESDGALFWMGRNLAKDGDFDPSEIGYVPQFSIAYDELTVDESLENATQLRVISRDLDDLDRRIDRVLQETGLAAIADRRIKVLSGGQKRRIGLAMELVSDPKLLLCDEVTSGLDPRSEREIVRLLHDLSRKDGRIVISVTHSLAHLELYDSILVLHEGRVAYHGPPAMMTHYFGVEDTEEVYPRLAKKESSAWAESWDKHRFAYYQKLDRSREEKIAQQTLRVPNGPGPRLADEKRVSESSEQDAADHTPPSSRQGDSTALVMEDREEPRTPGLFSQFHTLLARRWKIFLRDKGQLTLQIAMILIFPLIVSLFTESANENTRRFSQQKSDNLMERVTQEQQVATAQLKKGSGVSGLIMFEVVLLSLMGANNAAREIAGERKIMEKEKFAGLRPLAYLGSKGVFLAALVLAQSLWMAAFVQFFYAFEGSFVIHAGFLILINAAMTSICLGISSLMRTADQASLLSIYLVGFQLPLSGAILALPESINRFIQPAISAYWGWSGSISALDSSVLNVVRSVTSSPLSAHNLCLFVLICHFVVGILASLVGISRAQWD